MSVVCPLCASWLELQNKKDAKDPELITVGNNNTGMILIVLQFTEKPGVIM